ncbi:MAG: hypothetical protein V1897_06965 [Pseudomonadota bacterium]
MTQETGLVLTFSQALTAQGQAMDVVKADMERHVGELINAAQDAKREAEEFVIDSAEKARDAVDYGARMGKLEKQFEERRTGLVGPHNNFVTWVNGQFKKFAVPVGDGKKIVKQKLESWASDQQEKARKASEQAILEAKARQKETGEVATVVIPDAPGTTIRAGGGTFSMSREWTYQIKSESEIPADYWMRVLSVDRIKADIKAGVREIPGLLIYQASSSSITPKKV